MNESDRKRAMQVVLEIARQSAGDEIATKTKLFKAFYFAHLFYARDESRYLTEWPIVRMPNGPGIDRFDELLTELVDSGAMVVAPWVVGPYPTAKYRATGSLPSVEPLPPAAVDAIRKAVEFVSDKSGAQLSNITHEHSRAWNQAHDGDELNIYIDLLPEDRYSANNECHEGVMRDVAAVWGA